MAVRKAGRNKDFCKKYSLENRQEKNAKKRQAKHHEAHPNDAGQKGVVNYARKKPLTAYEQFLSVKKA
jgi:hypothetical protein